MNEFCDDDETPARILYALNSLYIKVSLKLLYLFKIYTCIYIHSLASSFLFLGLLTSSAQILCEGVSCFSQFRKEREKETFCCVFFFKCTFRVSNPNLFYLRERVFLFFGKDMKKCHSLESLFCLSVMWKCSLDLDFTRVNFLSRSVEIMC